MRVTMDERSNLIIEALKKCAAQSPQIVDASLESVAYEARAAVRHNLDNRMLRRRTSRLHDAYIYRKRGRHNYMVYPGGGRTASGKRVSLNYAAILERGGTINARSDSAMRFQIGAQWVTKRAVRIRGRHFVRDVKQRYLKEPATRRLEESLANEFRKRGLQA